MVEFSIEEYDRIRLSSCPLKLLHNLIFQKYAKHNYEIVSTYILKIKEEKKFEGEAHTYMFSKAETIEKLHPHLEELTKILGESDWEENLNKWSLNKIEENFSREYVTSLLQEFFIYIQFTKVIDKESKELFYDRLADYLDTLY
ncbi:MAG: hypothetical protein JW801_12650 [Bacteroidales bacterium]|nr:hypothetical protein [Bacteroidales bacterium]